MQHRPIRFRAALKVASLMSGLILLTGCLEFTQVLSWGANDTLDVRFIFRYSKTLAQMAEAQGTDLDIGSQVDDAKENIDSTLGSQVKDLRIVKTETEYDVAQEMSFTVPGYSRLSFAKLAGQEFPFVPAYDAAKKEVVFSFKAMKSMMPAADGDDAPPEAADNPAAEDDTAAQAGEMGKQAAQIFLSSVRYQILLGERMNPKRAVIRRGNKETEVAIIRVGTAAMIDIPLFAVYGEDQKEFNLVVSLK